MTIKVYFNPERSTAAACFLLTHSRNGERDLTTLLTLLYLADRQALLTGGALLTGSTYVKTPLGPIPRDVLDLHTGKRVPSDEECPNIRWKEHISFEYTSDRFASIIKAVPENTLSVFLRKKLSRVSDQFGHMSWLDLAHWITHNSPEADNLNVGDVIPYEAILKAHGASENRVRSIAADFEALNLRPHVKPPSRETTAITYQSSLWRTLFEQRGKVLANHKAPISTPRFVPADPILDVEANDPKASLMPWSEHASDREGILKELQVTVERTLHRNGCSFNDYERIELCLYRDKLPMTFAGVDAKATILIEYVANGDRFQELVGLGVNHIYNKLREPFQLGGFNHPVHDEIVLDFIPRRVELQPQSSSLGS